MIGQRRKTAVEKNKSPENQNFCSRMNWNKCCGKIETSVWWLILCVNVTRLRDAQIAGTILFLGVFVRVLPEGVSI